MKNDTATLIKLELCSLFGHNKRKYEKDPKVRKRTVALGVVWCFLILMVTGYVGGLVYGLHLIGISEVTPAYLAVISSLLIFVFAVFRAGHGIFSTKGYDILCGFPVRPVAIATGRFVGMYAEYFLIGTVIMLPGMVVYGVLEKPGWLFYPVMLIGTICIPALPLVTASAIGSVIIAISSKMKHKALVQSMLMVLFAIAAIAASMSFGQSAEEFTPEMLTEMAGLVSGLIGQLYPPAAWFGDMAMYAGGGEGVAADISLCMALTEFVIFIAFSIGLALLMIWIVSKFFHSIMRALFINSATHDYKMEQLNQNSVLITLLQKEWKRYFSSGIYVSNTTIGPIMGTVMAIAVLIGGIETIQEVIPLPIDMVSVLPFVIATTFGMMTTTSTSISMEGKNIWVLQSLPVSVKSVLDAKILLNLVLMAPFYVISEVVLMVALKPGITDVLWIILVPLSIILFAVVVGITVNLRFHSFDWEKEAYVVKQSLSSMLGGFVGMLVSLIGTVVIHILPTGITDLAKTVFCAGLLLLTFVLYQKNNRTKAIV